MKRTTVVENALKAFTLEECVDAEKDVSDWLQKYPDDLGLLEVAGVVGIAKAAALERESSRICSGESSLVAGSIK